MPAMFRPLQKQAMTLLGKLKYFSKPPIIVYDPSSYKVKGADVRELLGVLQPGDILLRAYDGYLDSWFIRSSRPLGKGARHRCAVRWPPGPARPRPRRRRHQRLRLGPGPRHPRRRATGAPRGHAGTLFR